MHTGSLEITFIGSTKMKQEQREYQRQNICLLMNSITIYKLFSGGIRTMELYWVSLLIQDSESSKPWLCAMTDGCISIEGAMELIKKGRKNYRVLSAWIDTFDKENHKTTIFHECYINALGDIE